MRRPSWQGTLFGQDRQHHSIRVNEWHLEFVGQMVVPESGLPRTVMASENDGERFSRDKLTLDDVVDGRGEVDHQFFALGFLVGVARFSATKRPLMKRPTVFLPSNSRTIQPGRSSQPK